MLLLLPEAAGADQAKVAGARGVHDEGQGQARARNDGGCAAGLPDEPEGPQLVRKPGAHAQPRSG